MISGTLRILSSPAGVSNSALQDGTLEVLVEVVLDSPEAALRKQVSKAHVWQAQCPALARPYSGRMAWEFEQKLCSPTYEQDKAKVW